MSTNLRIVNERGEYRQFLHMFTVVDKYPASGYPNNEAAPHIGSHFTYPWPYEDAAIDAQTIGVLHATYCINKFRGFPEAWNRFKAEYDACTKSTNHERVYGPYLMLLPQMGHNHIVNESINVKHAAHIAVTAELRRKFRVDDATQITGGTRDAALKMVREALLVAVLTHFSPYLAHPTEEMKLCG